MSSKGCALSWRTGSLPLPWERKDHSEKRALSYLFASRAPNTRGHVLEYTERHRNTHISGKTRQCSWIHHGERLPFSVFFETYLGAMWWRAYEEDSREEPSYLPFNAVSILTARATGCVVWKTHAVKQTPCCNWERIPVSFGSGIKFNLFSNLKGFFSLVWFFGKARIRALGMGMPVWWLIGPVYRCGPDWHISSTVGRVAMSFCTDIRWLWWAPDSKLLKSTIWALGLNPNTTVTNFFLL